MGETGGDQGVARLRRLVGTLIYLATYLFMNLGAFAVVTLIARSVSVAMRVMAEAVCTAAGGSLDDVVRVRI